MTTDPVWAGVTEKPPFLRSAEKCFFGQKCVLSQNKTPQFHQILIFILEEHSLFFAQFFSGRGQNMVRVKKWVFWAQNLGFWPNIFCHKTPNSLFVALRETVHFPRWVQCFDFSFPSYGRFCKENLADASKSLPPPQCECTVC